MGTNSNEVAIVVKLRELRQFISDAEKAAKEIEDMGKSTRKTGDEADKAASKMERLQKRAKGMRSAGQTLTRTFTLPLIGLGVASTRMAMKFEDAMTNISALVGASSEDMKMYRTGVLELAKVLPQSPQELAEGLYFISSSGFEGAAAMKVLEASAKAAAAGLGETETIADLVTSAINIYGESVVSATDATDILTATVRLGKGDPPQLAAAFARVLPIAEALGINFNQAGAGLAALTLGGLDAAEAATGMRGIFTSFIRVGPQATKVLKTMGMTGKDLREQVAKRGLMPVLMDLRKELGDDKDAMGKLFPNVRALNAFLSLTGANAEKNIGIFKDMNDVTGESATAFDKASQSAGFKFRSAISTIQVFMIEAGDVILPIVADITSKFAVFLEWFKRLPGPVKTAAIAFTLLLAVLGPLLVFTARIITALPIISTALVWLAKTLRLAAAAQWLMNTAVMGFPLVWILAAMIAVGVGLVIAWKKFEAFRNVVKAVWNWIKENWPMLLTIILGPIGAAVVGIVRNWGRISGFFKGVWDKTVAVFQAAWEKIKPILDKVIGAIETITGFFSSGNSDRANELAKEIARVQSDRGGSVWSGLARPENQAIGGVTMRSGLSWVGERGPELMALPVGARITPVDWSRSARVRRGVAPAEVEPVDLSGFEGGGTRTIVVPVYLNKRQIAKAVAEDVSDRKARK